MYLTRPVILQYLFRRPFGIHSPFLYDFAKNCIFSKEGSPDFVFLENQRTMLRHDPCTLEVTDFGKGSRFGEQKTGEEPLRYRRKVSSIARGSLQGPAMCRMLYRTVQYFSPATIVELGTSLGLTTAYLALAAPQAKIFTLEGCEHTAARAETLFRESGIKNIKIRTGDFRHTLPAVLGELGQVDLAYIDGDHSYEGVMNNFLRISEHIHPESVLIIDDIRWSKGMKRAWQEMAGHPKVTLAADLFRLGILFFNPALSKQIVPVGY
jgi:predicted O-methyltransferase YrrM